MVKRKRVGILLFDGESWAGGYYYVLSAIKALHSLPVEQQPELTIFYFNIATLDKVKEIGYQHIRYLPVYRAHSLSLRIINKIRRIFTKKDLLLPNPYEKNTVDYIFPYNYLSSYKSLSNLNKVYWIPDFQHLYYPDFFSKEELDKRNSAVLEISKKEDALVLSSNSAFNDYKKHYPDFRNKIHIIPFASILPDISSVQWEPVKAKYQLPGAFFFCPNQFWRHKNHITVLKAIKALKASGINIFVVFSGREDDPRDPGYVGYLKEFVAENNLGAHVKFLGFIDRKEQLKILLNALAVIQPSLFEGWSTVIEDAKALNQFAIASDIDVHKEQLSNNCLFFERTNEESLAKVIKTFLGTSHQKVVNNYADNIHKFAELLNAL